MLRQDLLTQFLTQTFAQTFLYNYENSYKNLFRVNLCGGLEGIAALDKSGTEFFTFIWIKSWICHSKSDVSECYINSE